MSLSLSLLGTFQVILDDEVVTDFGYDKVRALLAYLAVEPDHPLPREQIAALLWQEQSPEAALHSTSQALLKLRRALRDPAAVSARVRAERGTIHLVRHDGDTLDTRALDELLDACAGHGHIELIHCQDCIVRLERAVALYRGEFLQGVLIGDSAAFEEWVTIQREHYRQRVVTALDILTRHSAGRGKYDEAERYARRQIDLEPYLEEAHRALMDSLARSGKRSAALKQYETCRRVLAQELGIEPSAETNALYERLRRAGEERPHNLPLPLPVLIGREQERAQIAERLANPECRLLSLVGPGGIGKTALALDAAQAHLAAFWDGVYFVALAPLTDATQVPGAIAHALVLSLRGESDAPTQVLAHLRAKTMLLILDNFEQLLDATAFLIQLAREAPHVTLLVTSRERLNLRAEWILRIGGLDFPSAVMPSRALRDYQAVHLYLARAQRVAASFVPNEQDEKQIARVCQMLWGSPLGIELAAGWMGERSCREIADEIAENLDFLETSQGDVPERHHSLRAVLEQSWRHLSQAERRVLPRLAVFRLPFQRAAAGRVTGVTALELDGLVNKSWIALGADGWYDLHPLVKQFLTEKLVLAGELDALREQHAMYFGEWAAARSPHRKPRGELTTFQDMRRANEELSAALLWAAEQRDVRVFLLVANDYYDFLAVVGQYEQGIRLFGQIAHLWEQHPELTIDEERLLAQQYGFRGSLELLLGADESAAKNLETSLNLAYKTEDTKQVAFATHALARMAFGRAEVERARALEEQHLQLRLEIKDFTNAQYARFMLGNIALETGRLADAEAMYTQGLEGIRATGRTDGLGFAFPLNGLGVVAFRRGNPALAREYLEASLRYSRALGHAWSNAECLQDLARLTADEGAYERAAELVDESLGFYEAIGKRGDAAHALRVRGWLAECQNDLVEAKRWYWASRERFEEVRRQVSAPLPLTDLGRVLARMGDTGRSRTYLERALTFFEQVGYPYGLVIAETGLGIAARAEGEPVEAQSHFENALLYASESDERYEGIKTLYELASLLHAQHEDEKAMQMFDQVAHHPATPRHIRLRAAAHI